MIITYYGGECFKVSFGDLTLAFNPPSKSSNLKAPSFGADIVLVSINHPDMNGVGQVTRGGRDPFVVQGPGEYEVRDVVIKGVATSSGYGKEKNINTTYLVTLEGMTLGFLGALGSKELPPKLKEAIDTIDILFVPIGGEGVLDPREAHELSVHLEPSVVIPMHYGEIGIKDALKLFLKEEGQEKAEKLDKLSIKKRDLDGKEGEIIVLSS